MKAILLISLICLTFISETLQNTFDYSDEGTWPPTCTGNRQSPINFSSETSYPHSPLSIVKSDYPITSATLTFLDHEVVGIDARGFGSLYIKKGNIEYKYDTKYISFHVESEHTVNDVLYDMEVQIIHNKDHAYLKEKNINDPDPNNNVIGVAVLGKSRINDDNPAFDILGVYNEFKTTNLNVNAFFNVTGSFYSYEGSLTTPFCDEDVEWIVMKDAVELSEAQINHLDTFIRRKFTEGNNRVLKSNEHVKIYSSMSFMSYSFGLLGLFLFILF